MSITKMEIENITAFEKVEIDFASGVNVFIGENGTGKTHLLKMIYNAHVRTSALFGDSKELVRFSNEKGFYKIYKHEEIVEAYVTNGISVRWDIPIRETYSSNSIIFIPAKEMLTHARGLIAMSKKYSQIMPFDRTHLDIIENAEVWVLDHPPELAKRFIPRLENIIGGKIIQDNGDFFVKHPDGSTTNYSMEAEGIKKLGLLWRLIMNGSIADGTILLWDEPEANINPTLIPLFVDLLIELSRNDIQIFLSTHDYVISKYFEVKRTEKDAVLFHSLQKTDNGVKCESNENFRDLKNNPIIEAFDVLLDDVIRLNVGD